MSLANFGNPKELGPKLVDITNESVREPRTESNTWGSNMSEAAPTRDQTLEPVIGKRNAGRHLFVVYGLIVYFLDSNVE